MKVSQCLAAAAALWSYATAFPALSDNFEERQARGDFIFNPEGSVRAPCPGLNTMANHGFIHRSGKGITKQQVQQGFLDAFGMAFDATNGGAQSALNLCSQLFNNNNPCTTFDLNMINVPHRFEHDASLSRCDRQMLSNRDANNVAFNQTIWGRTLAIYGATSHIEIRLANTARIKRIQQAKGADFPGWFQENRPASLSEHAFILATMNDPALGVNLDTPGANPMARMEWLNFWITKMQLPTPLGWKKPTRPVTNANMQSLIAAIKAAPTVAQNPGPSPFLRQKRSLPGGPQPSYNLELESRDVFTPATPTFEERASHVVPLGEVPSLAGDPATEGKLQRAKARAREIVGAPPEMPNPYAEVVGVEEWGVVGERVDAYTERFQRALGELLGGVLGVGV